MAAPSDFWWRWRVFMGYPLALATFWLARPTLRSLPLGAAIGVLGLLVRGAAAGYLRKHEALATCGPYGCTRNPLYFGSALLATGWVVAGGSGAAAVLVAAYFLLFYLPVMKREEQELRIRYRGAFEDYAARVPLFWPRPALRGVRNAKFSWALYRRNREARAAVGFLLAVVLLALKIYVHR